MITKFKVLKYNNDLTYDSVYNFNKYGVSNFNEITLVDSKFNTLNKFYEELKKLEAVTSKTKETKQKKVTLLKNASLLYDELISIYKKECNQTFKGMDKEWRLKHDYKNLKDSDYQLDQLQPE